MPKNVLVNSYPNSLNATDIVQKQFCSLGKSRNQMGLYMKASVYHHTGGEVGGGVSLPIKQNNRVTLKKTCLSQGLGFL